MPPFFQDQLPVQGPLGQKDNAASHAYWQGMSSAHNYWKAYLRVKMKRSVWNLTIGISMALKRIIDIIVALATSLISLPLILLVALLIKLEDGGPIFFSQKRVGHKGRLFIMYKFRSMVTNAHALKENLIEGNEMTGGVLFKMKKDPRITRVGAFIRKYSIDELPQLLNILRGEMSLVGPRPCLPEEVRQYRPEDLKRFLAKPGLTCFWQIEGRSHLSFEQQMQLDIKYIQSRSIITDLAILLKTIPVVLLGKGSY